ncbi:MAG: lipopolysaccharide assembly protein LapA domain-containing protein [Prochlorococcus sp.]
MRQVNFTLIFSFGLAMVFFTLENTTATTVRVIPGVKYTLPLAALLLVVTGLGAAIAWLFAAWSGMLKQVDSLNNENESEAQQVRIQELETDLNRYRATVQTQLGLLPASISSSEASEEEESEDHDDEDGHDDDKTVSIDPVE